MVAPRGPSVTPSSPRPEALSAPDLIGPTSILKQPTDGPRSNRRRRNRPYRHVHLEVDLTSGPKREEIVPRLEQLEAFLSQKDVVETADLVRLTAQTLHALSAQRFRQVDHWEVTPGGWLPPPEPTSNRRTDGEEPVGHLLRALEGGAWSAVAQARSFSLRLSDLGGNHVDVVVRRVHRERRHTLSLDLWGHWTKESVGDLQGALASRLPVERSVMTKFMYAD